MNDDLLWILEWYDKQCDGDWEHGHGIKMGTIDNPGWSIKISLDDTEVQNKKFNMVDLNRSENDWLYCCVEEKVFEGFGGPFNLPELLAIFRDWVEC